tara:strand:- start:199 stop:498 length:300 start_codon:yes stop_codon:yes gene_type:complete
MNVSVNVRLVAVFFVTHRWAVTQETQTLRFGQAHMNIVTILVKWVVITVTTRHTDAPQLQYHPVKMEHHALTVRVHTPAIVFLDLRELIVKPPSIIALT